jgi:hypothetical protein
VQDQFAAWHKQHCAGDYVPMPHGPPRLSTLDGSAELGWDQRSWQAVTAHADSLGDSHACSPAGGVLDVSSNGSLAIGSPNANPCGAATVGGSLGGAAALDSSANGGVPDVTVSPVLCSVLDVAAPPVLCDATTLGGAADCAETLDGSAETDSAGSAALDSTVTVDDLPDVTVSPVPCAVLDVAAPPLLCDAPPLLCDATTLGGTADGVATLDSSTVPCSAATRVGVVTVGSSADDGSVLQAAGSPIPSSLGGVEPLSSSASVHVASGGAFDDTHELSSRSLGSAGGGITLNFVGGVPRGRRFRWGRYDLHTDQVNGRAAYVSTYDPSCMLWYVSAGHVTGDPTPYHGWVLGSSRDLGRFVGIAWLEDAAVTPAQATAVWQVHWPDGEWRDATVRVVDSLPQRAPSDSAGDSMPEVATLA